MKSENEELDQIYLTKPSSMKVEKLHKTNEDMEKENFMLKAEIERVNKELFYLKVFIIYRMKSKKLNF